jgi:hypothetical protein
MKEKNKKGGLRCGRLPPHPVGAVSPIAQRCNMCLIFWPLHPLMLHTMATLRPVCFCAIEDGRYERLVLRREGVRRYSGCYPHCYRGMCVIVIE